MITLDDFENHYDEFKHILEENAAFLNVIRDKLCNLYETYPEIFRRPPEARPKKVKSIIKKLNDDGIEKAKVIEGLKKIEDLAGARMTIATQDQYSDAEKLVLTSLSELGSIKLKKRWRWNSLTEEEKHPNGYCADHFMIYKKENEDVKCEVQVRTLSHDLWAVFTHAESYKSKEKVVDSRFDEIKNYSRLMDVSDYYAKLIKDRKVQEANEYHKRHSPNSDSLLTVEILQGELYRKNSAIDQGKKDVIKLCEILKELSSFLVFTVTDLKEIIDNTTCMSILLEIINEVNSEKGTTYKMETLDAFQILYKCRMINKPEFISGDISRSMRNIVKGFVSAWHLEKTIDDRANGLAFKDDGKNDS